MSDTSPLIQLALADYLWLLPQLYTVVIPEAVYRETQRYPHLPDAIEIAIATESWLKIRRVKHRSRIEKLRREYKLGLGEAEALTLYQEIKANALLTTDSHTIKKAQSLGARTKTLASIGQEAYRRKILDGEGVYKYADRMIQKRLLDTEYMRRLKEQAEKWSLKPN